MNISNRKLYNEIQTLKRKLAALTSDVLIIQVGSAFHSASLGNTMTYEGDILYAGTSSQAGVAKSHLVYLDHTKQWKKATAGVTNAGARGAIGVALSAVPHTDGVLVHGLYRINSSYVSGSVPREGWFDLGTQVFIHPISSGSFTTLIPSGSGQIVRVVGHSVDGDMIYFNPSKDFVEIS